MLWDIETKLQNLKLFFQSNVDWNFQTLTLIYKRPKFLQKMLLQLLLKLLDIETKLQNPKLFFQSNVDWNFQTLTLIWKWPKFSKKNAAATAADAIGN